MLSHEFYANSLFKMYKKIYMYNHNHVVLRAILHNILIRDNIADLED